MQAFVPDEMKDMLAVLAAFYREIENLSTNNFNIVKIQGRPSVCYEMKE